MCGSHEIKKWRYFLHIQFISLTASSRRNLCFCQQKGGLFEGYVPFFLCNLWEKPSINNVDNPRRTARWYDISQICERFYREKSSIFLLRRVQAKENSNSNIKGQKGDLARDADPQCDICGFSNSTSSTLCNENICYEWIKYLCLHFEHCPERKLVTNSFSFPLSAALCCPLRFKAFHFWTFESSISTLASIINWWLLDFVWRNSCNVFEITKVFKKSWQNCCNRVIWLNRNLSKQKTCQKLTLFESFVLKISLKLVKICDNQYRSYW